MAAFPDVSLIPILNVYLREPDVGTTKMYMVLNFNVILLLET